MRSWGLGVLGSWASPALGSVRAAALAGRLSRPDHGRHGHRQQPGRLEHRLLAAAARRVARLDADRPHLPVLPVHRRRRDSPGLGPRARLAARAAAHGGDRRTRLVPRRISVLPAGHPPHPGSSAANRAVLLRRRLHRAPLRARPAAPSAGGHAHHRRAARRLLVPHDERGAAGWHGRRPLGGRQPRRVGRPRTARRAPLAPGLGSRGPAEHVARGRDHTARCAGRPRGAGRVVAPGCRARPGRVGPGRCCRRPRVAPGVSDQQGAVDQLLRAVHWRDRGGGVCLVLRVGGRDAHGAPRSLVRAVRGARPERAAAVCRLRAGGEGAHLRQVARPGAVTRRVALRRGVRPNGAAEDRIAGVRPRTPRGAALGAASTADIGRPASDAGDTVTA